MFLPRSEEEFFCLQILNKVLYPNSPRPQDLVVVVDRSHRVRLLARAWLDFLESPWLGKGLGGYRFVSSTSYDPQPRTYTYPHNLLLEFLATVGIVGTLGFAAAVIYALVLLERARIAVRTRTVLVWTRS